MKNQAKRLEGHLSGSNVLDWRAFALIEPLFFTFGVATFLSHEPGDTWTTYLKVLAGLVFEVLVAYLLRPILLPRFRQNSIWLIWVLFWLVGELNAIFYIVIFDVPFRNPTDGISAWTLISTNGLLRIEWFTVAHLALSILRSDIRVLKALQVKSMELSSLRDEVNGQLARELSGLRETIADKITIALEHISRQVDGLTTSTPKADLVAGAVLVSKLCDTEVRALSHEISQREFRPVVGASGSSKNINPFSRVPMRPDEVKLRWQWVAGIGVLNALAISLEHGGWIGAASALIAIGVGIVLINAMDSFRRKYLHSKSVPGVVGLIIGEYVFATAVIMTSLWFVGQSVPNIMNFVKVIYVLVPVVILIIWALVQVIIEFTRRLRYHSEELADQVALLEHEVSMAQMKAAKARNRIGKLLHGTTQGRLASVSLALTAAASTDSHVQMEMLLGQAREQLSRAEEDLQTVLSDDGAQQPSSLDEELRLLVDGWRNMVEIRHAVDAAAYVELNSRPELVANIAEAMQECVTNAVRHGQASSISIDVRVDGDFVVTVSNDGNAVSEIVPGFGIRAIYEQANNVRIETRGGLTVVVIRWAPATH